MSLAILLEGNNLQRLFNGLLITAQISLISVSLSCFFGVFFGIVMTSHRTVVRCISRFYLETIRIIPLLVWLFVAYFGIAKWFNIHLDGMTVCIGVFIFWGTAEMGDLMRGALHSIEKHQRESAYALGLNTTQTFLYVLLPQSLKRVTPSAINLFTRMIKTSSLAMLIGVLEVVKVGQQIIETSLFTDPSAAFWIYGLIFILYFAICYPLSLFSRYIENRWE